MVHYLAIRTQHFEHKNNIVLAQCLITLVQL